MGSEARKRGSRTATRSRRGPARSSAAICGGASSSDFLRDEDRLGGEGGRAMSLVGRRRDRVPRPSLGLGEASGRIRLVGPPRVARRLDRPLRPEDRRVARLSGRGSPRSRPGRIAWSIGPICPRGSVFVKHFLVPSWREKLRQWFRRGKGRNEGKRALEAGRHRGADDHAHRPRRAAQTGVPLRELPDHSRHSPTLCLWMNSSRLHLPAFDSRKTHQGRPGPRHRPRRADGPPP